MSRKHNIWKAFYLSIIVFGVVSCTNTDIFLQYQNVTSSGWDKDSLYAFDIDVADTSATYNVYINIRNESEYSHQNLWLFIREMTPDSVEVSDTINFFLADQRGKWLGSGIGSVFEMPVLYKQGVKFSKQGVHRYEIFQGMRDSILVGINDVGMRVEKD